MHHRCGELLLCRAVGSSRLSAPEAAVSDLHEILAQEGLTVEQLFYELLLLETKPTEQRDGERRRISNRPRDPHHRPR